MKKLSLLLAALCILSINACKKSSSDNQTTPTKSTFKIAVLSDIHYMDPSLLVHDGPAFQAYLKMDRKLLAESDAILRESVTELLVSKPDLVLISGDLTKDGELISHQSVAGLISQLINAGIKVRVTVGNHDVNNPHALKYDGTNATRVPSVRADDIKSIYANSGYGDALYSDPNSLSYVSEPIPNLWLITIDAAEYYNNNDSTDVTEGIIKPETMTWALARLAEANLKGKTVIGMMHHGILEHFSGQATMFSEYVVDNWSTVSDQLMNAGLKIMFTGHFHANDIVKKATGNNFLFDIETGSTVTYPCPYRVITYVKDSTLAITTNHITTINYAGLNGQPFATYAKNALQAGMDTISKLTLMAPPYYAPAPIAMAVAPRMRNAMMAHYAGDESLSADENALIQATIAQAGALGPILNLYLMSLWTDLTPKDNTLTINLKTGSSN
ncbi:MAG: metallophosphoesterase [Bacteroidota bacterium]